MGGNIRLYMGDWLFNSGLVGFYNILNYAGDEVILDGNYLEFNPEVLINFEEKYFNYFINKYWNVMVLSKILEKVSYLSKVDFEIVDKNEYKSDIEYVNLKLGNSSYKSIRKMIPKSMLNLKNIKNNVFHDLLQMLLDNKEQILKSEVTGYYDQKARQSKMPHSIIDKYINTNMLDIEKICSEIYLYNNEDKSKFVYECFSCGAKIKKIDKGLSFLTNTFFDTSRKTSHVWNFNNDIEMCPVCLLIYYCIPAGFSTVYGKGIYINNNSTMNSAIDVNNKISREILKEHEVNRSLTYRALINSIQEQFIESSKYDLSDIQVVKYDNGKYQFNILTRSTLNIIYKSNNDLHSLIRAGYKEINTYFNVYDLVIDNLLNNQNLNLIIYKLLVYKLSTPKDCFYTGKQIVNVMNINYRFMRGLGCMEKLEEDVVKKANQQGYFLREEYRNKKAVSKLNGISYRLLNALKVNSKDMFMDTVLNCYLYTSKAVPDILLEGLKDDVAFKTIGYAFVSGLIEGKENVKNGGEK